MLKNNAFGEYLKKMRIARKMTLRDFCKKFTYNPSDWCSLEAGLYKAPRDVEKLKKLASHFDIDESKAELWKEFIEKATISFLSPIKELTEKELIKYLPAYPNKKIIENLDGFIRTLKEALTFKGHWNK